MALNFSTRYPNKVEKIIAIACGIKSPILTKTHNLEQIMSIENDVTLITEIITRHYHLIRD